MIPKTVHYCWFGRAPMSDLNRRCLESWRRVLSGYQLKEWNETNSTLDDEYCRAAYASGSWSRLSNAIRLRALYMEGGIYLDTDVEVVRDFAPLLHHRCFIGFQQKEEETDWVNMAVMGAEPGHHFLKRSLELMQKLFAETGQLHRGPTIATAVIREMGLREYGLQEVEGVTIYPAEFFYPFPWFGKLSHGCVTEKTYSIHHWEGTWQAGPLRRRVLWPLQKWKRRMRPFIPGSK